MLMHYAEDVANHMKIPSIVLRTNGASAVLAYFALPQLQAEGHVPLKKERGGGSQNIMLKRSSKLSSRKEFNDHHMTLILRLR